ncbi:MAG TPA: GNAT family N-acetyltransferase [Ktedonobacterales bacterium]|nr:GNAT family N-acetyltransferase [Ktedonobacterales bacterium]
MKAIQPLIASVPLCAALEQQAQDVVYYQPAWLNLISQVYGCSINTLTTTNTNGEISGFLPVCTLRSPVTGKRLVALPFSDHCPLLVADGTSAEELVEQALRLAGEQNARYLELRTGNHPALAARSDLAESALYVRWLLWLQADPDGVWAGLSKSVKQMIRKSQKMGVTVRLAERREEMAHYYRLHLQTRTKKHGMPSQPQRFFFGLWDAFAASGALQLLLAEHEGRVIAGMILLASGSTIRDAYSASDASTLSLAPNNLLMWQAITWGCAHGYRTLDMGRTACDNEGLMSFKRRWGAIKEPLAYYYYPRMDGLASTPEQSWKFRLLTNCWRQMPLQVAGPLGGHLYKHLG